MQKTVKPNVKLKGKWSLHCANNVKKHNTQLFTNQ